jgi:hypothetical protein
MKRTVRAVELMHLLPQLKDPQSELFLLRSCMGIAKLFFGLRTCQPIYMVRAAILFDKELRAAVEDIVVGGGPFFGDLQWRVASLPIKVGGLGLYSTVEAALIVTEKKNLTQHSIVTTQYQQTQPSFTVIFRS